MDVEVLSPLAGKRVLVVEDEPALAEQMNRRGKPFIFSTGYGKSGIPKALQTTPILQKPFRQSDFAAALRAALSL